MPICLVLVEYIYIGGGGYKTSHLKKQHRLRNFEEKSLLYKPNNQLVYFTSRNSFRILHLQDANANVLKDHRLPSSGQITIFMRVLVKV